MRLVINDGMDIIGGKGICMGQTIFLAVRIRLFQWYHCRRCKYPHTQSHHIRSGRDTLSSMVDERNNGSFVTNKQEALESFDEALMGILDTPFKTVHALCFMFNQGRICKFTHRRAERKVLSQTRSYECRLFIPG